MAIPSKIELIGIVSNNLQTSGPNLICDRMFSGFIYHHKTGSNQDIPKWVNRCEQTSVLLTMEYYSVIKRNKLLNY